MLMTLFALCRRHCKVILWPLALMRSEIFQLMALEILRTLAVSRPLRFPHLSLPTN